MFYGVSKYGEPLDCALSEWLIVFRMKQTKEVIITFSGGLTKTYVWEQIYVI